MTETIKESTQEILIKITNELKCFLNHHKFKYIPFSEFNYAQIKLNWAIKEEPNTVIQLYKQLNKMFQLYEIDKEIDILISHGNIEFRNHKEDDCTQAELFFTKEYLEFYSHHEDYINELMYELHSYSTIDEPLGLSISMLKSKYNWMFKIKEPSYKNINLLNAFVYEMKGDFSDFLNKKDTIVSIFNRYGDFDFIWNDKYEEMNNHWCLFIKPKNVD